MISERDLRLCTFIILLGETHVMSLSRPIYSLLGVYFEQLFNHPVRTKSLTA